MASENLNIDEITEARAKAISDSIQTITVAELKKLGEGLFPFFDHPWRTLYFDFLAENPGATMYHATTNDRIQIIYCREREKGMWFVPGSGMGPLQAKGLGILKKIVDGGK